MDWCAEQLELGLKTQKSTPKQGEHSREREISPVGGVGRQEQCSRGGPVECLKLWVVSALHCFSRGGSPCNQDTAQ